MSDRVSNKWMATTISNLLTEKHSTVLAVSELYDLIRQVLLELNDFPEKPTESRCKATSLFSVTTLSKFCRALCIPEHVVAHAQLYYVATKG